MKAVTPCHLRLDQREGNASKRRARGHKPDQFVIATAKKVRCSWLPHPIDLFTAQCLGALDDRLQAHHLARVRFIFALNHADWLRFHLFILKQLVCDIV